MCRISGFAHSCAPYLTLPFTRGSSCIKKQSSPSPQCSHFIGELEAQRQVHIIAEVAGRITHITLGGFIGFFALRDSDLESAASRVFTVTPNVQWPLLQLGNARARQSGTQAQSTGAMARYEQALLLAQEEVENAMTQLVLHQDRLAALIQSAKHGNTALTIATKRYRAGAGSYMTVLDNQRVLFDIQQDVVAD